MLNTCCCCCCANPGGKAGAAADLDGIRGVGTAEGVNVFEVTRPTLTAKRPPRGLQKRPNRSREMQIRRTLNFTAKGSFNGGLSPYGEAFWSPRAPVGSTALSHLDTSRQGHAADLQLAPAGGQSRLDSPARTKPDWFNQPAGNSHGGRQ